MEREKIEEIVSKLQEAFDAVPNAPMAYCCLDHHIPLYTIDEWDVYLRITESKPHKILVTASRPECVGRER